MKTVPRSFRASSTFAACLLAVSPSFLPLSAPAQDSSGGQITINVNMDKPGVPVSPMLYGLMTEEINHSYDGGLYGELIQNRAFKDDSNIPVHWSLVQDGGSGVISLDKSQPLNDKLPVSLKLDVSQPGTRVGIANDGYWGIPIWPATPYKVSFFAKSAAPCGPVTVSLESADGSQTFAKSISTNITTDWKKYSVSLVTGPRAPRTDKARFVISTSSSGTIWFNLVSLFPPTYANRRNGNRIDLMLLLSQMNPKFLRLPGGNYLEGMTIDTRFPWKQTLGPLDQRPGHPGTWNYRSSDGLGLLEYLDWCEDMKAEPVLAVFAGYALNKTTTQPGPALQPFVDEALEEIEYVTGDAKTTKWGAERAKDGHSAPFHLTYVEIGNEDFFDKSGSYEGRYSQFYKAIKARYPDLQLIATTKVKSMRPDVVDEHYYLSTGDMESMATKYDHYSRSGPKVFAGEWATRRGQWKNNSILTPNLGDSLADAAWLTGLERNSDIVVMQCYAPLLVNVNPGAHQWDIDLIGYDAINAYGSPSYYIQKMFGAHLGDKVVPTDLQNVPTQIKISRHPTNPPQQIPAIFADTTRDSKTGNVFLKVVNTVGTPANIQINVKGAQQVSQQGTAYVVSGNDPEDTNSIDDPKHVIPVTSPVNGVGSTFSYTFAPYSANILQFQAQ